MQGKGILMAASLVPTHFFQQVKGTGMLIHGFDQYFICNGRLGQPFRLHWKQHTNALTASWSSAAMILK